MVDIITKKRINEIITFLNSLEIRSKRFYEIMQVYGLPMKDVIQEKFGDGIMSAIDFSIEVDKVEDPKGDRVLVKMCGKFLPYKKW